MVLLFLRSDTNIFRYESCFYYVCTSSCCRSITLVCVGAVSAAMLVMESNHADEMARLRDASSKELEKVQQENYVLTVCSRTPIFVKICVCVFVYRLMFVYDR